MLLCYWIALFSQWLHLLWRRWHLPPSFRPAKGFRPAPPRRRGGKPKPRWAIDELLRLHKETGSYRLAMHAFNRLYAHTGVTVCLNTVHTWVQKYTTEMESVRRATRNRVPPPAPPNLRWCLDGTGKKDEQGTGHFILGILDHGTRFCITLKRMAHENAQAILDEIASAVDIYGKPRFIRTDNATVSRSAVFREGLAALGIRHEFIIPGKPWLNGRIERLFLTLKQKLNQIIPTDAVMLDRLLGEFRFWYNAIRPHQHLHGLTPMEVWTGVDPYRRTPKDVVRFTGWDGLLTGFDLRR